MYISITDITMPQLTGSTKQIQWANQIRDRIISTNIALYSQQIAKEIARETPQDEIDNTVRTVLIPAIQNVINQELTARYWIDHRYQSGDYYKDYHYVNAISERIDAEISKINEAKQKEAEAQKEMEVPAEDPEMTTSEEDEVDTEDNEGQDEKAVSPYYIPVKDMPQPVRTLMYVVDRLTAYLPDDESLGLRQYDKKHLDRLDTLEDWASEIDKVGEIAATRTIINAIEQMGEDEVIDYETTEALKAPYLTRISHLYDILKATEKVINHYQYNPKKYFGRPSPYTPTQAEIDLINGYIVSFSGKETPDMLVL